MKKALLFLCFALLCMSVSAQQTFIVWKGNKATIHAQPFDSLTFSLPEDHFNIKVGSNIPLY